MADLLILDPDTRRAPSVDLFPDVILSDSVVSTVSVVIRNAGDKLVKSVVVEATDGLEVSVGEGFGRAAPLGDLYPGQERLVRVRRPVLKSTGRQVATLSARGLVVT